MRKTKIVLDKVMFYYSILKYRLLLYLIINIVVTLLDGLGLAMFIPLLSTLSKNTQNNLQIDNVALNNFLAFLQSILKSPTLITILLSIIFIFIIKGIFKAIQTNYLAKLRYISLTKLRIGLLEKYENISYEGYLKIDSGKIYNTITTEVGKIFNNLTNFIITIQNCIIVTTYLFLITIISVQFASISLFLLIVINLLFNNFIKKAKTTSEEITDESNTLFNLLFQTNSNFKYLKSTNKLPFFIHKLGKLVKKIEKLNFKMGKELSIIEGLKEPIAIIIITSIIYIQINIFEGKIESILISLMLLYRAIVYLNALKSGWQSFNQTFGSIEAVKRLNIELELNKENNLEGIITTGINSIKLIDVTISYSSNPVLENINIEIPKNNTIALVGESGVGKTSIINSILGLIVPKKGTILINNTSIRNLDLKKIRNDIGYITQDPAIFNDTLYNNISFFAPRTKENLDLFWEVIDITSLGNFVSNLINKEDTIIGSNGTTISGGQKQRIAIARELFKKVDLLIMDEATSSLDYELENTIKENLKALKGKITIIIIAHRHTTIKEADKIYLLHNKRIESMGDYEELLKTSPRFQKMTKVQIN